MPEPRRLELSRVTVFELVERGLRSDRGLQTPAELLRYLFGALGIESRQVDAWSESLHANRTARTTTSPAPADRRASTPERRAAPRLVKGRSMSGSR